MNMNDEIVYFELNNWFEGIDFPNTEPFITWCSNDYNLYFNNEKWVKENKLCVVQTIIDMSVNWCITATKEWVEENCPDLLSNKSYDITSIIYDHEGEHKKTESFMYNSFLRTPDQYGDVYGKFDCKFLEYNENNIGITRY